MTYVVAAAPSRVRFATFYNAYGVRRITDRYSPFQPSSESICVRCTRRTAILFELRYSIRIIQ